MNESTLLCLSAAGIGTLHTFMGPDHYIPFVAMARAGNWTVRKTLVVSVLCGVGHVLGSIALGVIGIVLGTAIFTLEQIESVRGEIAAWLLITMGLLFFAWSGVRAIRRRPHTHWHVHEGGTVHCHEHGHEADHMHVHAGEREEDRMTPWLLFVIFVFGPCEPLIPLLMFPAAAGSWWLVIAVTAVFAVTTIVTMTALVWVGVKTTSGLRGAVIGRFAQPLAGLMILGCGLLIKAGF